MGVSVKTLSRLLGLKQASLFGPGAKMLEFGAQNLYGVPSVQAWKFAGDFCPAAVLDRSDEMQRIGEGSTMASLMKLCEIDYLAIDIFDTENTMLFDLNTSSVLENMKGKFDLVTNFGTTEHVINQFNSFLCLHDFTKVGGIMYHDVPMGGYYYHGYFIYTPLFFHHLARANNYEILFKCFGKKSRHEVFDETSDEMNHFGWPDGGSYHHASIEFILRKTRDEPFRVPVEVGTSNAVDHEFLNRMRSDIVVLDGERDQ